MRAREKLNRAFLNGSVALAALVGLATHSLPVFALTLGVLLVTNLAFNEIRLRRQGHGSDDARL
jgi:hypothetical protein